MWKLLGSRQYSWNFGKVHRHVECRKRGKTVDDGEMVDRECRIFMMAEK